MEIQTTWPVVGHKKNIEFLHQSILKGKTAHAYLFYGPAKVGKFKVALEFAKALECEHSASSGAMPCQKCSACERIENMSHPDVMVIKPEENTKSKKVYTKEIGIKEVQKIQHHLSLFAHSSPYKIIIVDGAEKLSREAANAFLKTLEEPTNKSVIILITEAIGEILPTISSRTQPVKFLPVSKEEMKKAEGILSEKYSIRSADFDKFLNLSSGKPGLFIELAKDPSLYGKKIEALGEFLKVLDSDISVRYRYAADISGDISKAKEIIGDWLIFFRDLLLIKEKCPRSVVFNQDPALLKKFSSRYDPKQLKNIILEITNTLRLISNTSLNSKLILEVLFLKI